MGDRPAPSMTLDRYADWLARGRAHQKEGRVIDALLCYRRALHEVAAGVEARFHVWRDRLAVRQLGRRDRRLGICDRADGRIIFRAGTRWLMRAPRTVTSSPRSRQRGACSSCVPPRPVRNAAAACWRRFPVTPWTTRRLRERSHPTRSGRRVCWRPSEQPFSPTTGVHGIRRRFRISSRRPAAGR